MSRPKTHTKPRSTTAVRFQTETLVRLKAAAAERDVSANFLVERAVEDFLARLLPLSEIVWTRPLAGELPLGGSSASK